MVSTEGGKAKAVQAHVCTALLKCTPHPTDDKLQVQAHTYTHTHTCKQDTYIANRTHVATTEAASLRPCETRMSRVIWPTKCHIVCASSWWCYV